MSAKESTGPARPSRRSLLGSPRRDERASTFLPHEAEAYHEKPDGAPNELSKPAALAVDVSRLVVDPALSPEPCGERAGARHRDRHCQSKLDRPRVDGLLPLVQPPHGGPFVRKATRDAPQQPERLPAHAPVPDSQL